MIKSLSISGLRGIESGSLTDLTPLVVLVGPNGSGKSTVLDALMIAAAPAPQSGLQTVESERSPSGRFFFWKGDPNSKVQIGLVSEKGTRKVSVGAVPGMPGPSIFPRVTAWEARETNGSPQLPAGDSTKQGPLADVPEFMFVQPGQIGRQQESLVDLYSRAVKHGLRKEVKQILLDLLPGADDIEVLTENNQPTVFLHYPRLSHPIALSGSGVHLLFRAACKIASPTGGLVLLEEPETHLHPGAIRQLAKVVLTAVRRNIQIVIATHSLDLIDALLTEATDRELDLISLYRLRLSEGKLTAHRRTGREAATVRAEIQDDLR